MGTLTPSLLLLASWQEEGYGKKLQPVATRLTEKVDKLEASWGTQRAFIES